MRCLKRDEFNKDFEFLVHLDFFSDRNRWIDILELMIGPGKIRILSKRSIQCTCREK